jgi:glycosyltransferase involved in cell wall biosynthesis
VAVSCREGAIAERIRRDGVKVLPLAYSDGIDVLTPFRLARRAQNFDLMHAHMNRASLYTRIASWLSGIPWVTTAHGMTRGSYYRGSSQVLAVSEAVKLHLEAQGVTPVTEVPNGLPPLEEAQEAELQDLWERIGRTPGRKLAVVLANLHRNKGQDLVVEALALLPEEYHLLLAGAGELPELEALYREHPGLESRVHRVGILSSAAAPFEVADLVLVPSRREAFSLVAAEARLRGKPLIVADVDGLRQVVPDEAPGCRRVAGRDPCRWAEVWAEVGEKLPTLRSQSEAGRTQAQVQFSLETQVQATVAIYRRLLGRLRA